MMYPSCTWWRGQAACRLRSVCTFPTASRGRCLRATTHALRPRPRPPRRPPASFGPSHPLHRRDRGHRETTDLTVMAWSVVCTCVALSLYPLYALCGGSELPTLWTLRSIVHRPAPSLVNGAWTKWTQDRLWSLVTWCFRSLDSTHCPLLKLYWYTAS